MVINSRPYRYRVEDIQAIYQLMNNGQAKERRRKLFYTDEPTRDFLEYEEEMDRREQEYIASLAKCCACGEPLWNPFYEIYGDLYCENCVDDMKQYREPPVVERNY